VCVGDGQGDERVEPTTRLVCVCPRYAEAPEHVVIYHSHI